MRNDVVKHQLLFVQGGGQGTHDAWDDKLVASLQRELGDEYDIHYPRMPGEDDPHYAPWSTAIEEALRPLRDGAVLVGHSVGGTILLKTLTDRPMARKLGAIVLVAAPFSARAAGQPTSCSCRTTLARAFRRTLPSTSSRDSMTTSHHRPMSSFTRARSRRLASIVSPGGTTSSTMT
jgi:predicted alpha/beta hydrolase family esterase